jgi:hypothetical protein
MLGQVLTNTRARGDKTMKRTTLRNMKCGIIMTVVILMISVVPVTAQSVTAQDEAPERLRRLEGVWLVTITPRNCIQAILCLQRRLNLYLRFIETEQCSSRSETTALCLSVRQLMVFGGATAVGEITPSSSFTSAVISRPDYLPETRKAAGPWY